MIELLITWLALVGILLVWVCGRARYGALTVAYFLSLSLIHVPGVLAAAFPGTYLIDLDATRIGFEMTLFGMAAYIAGAAAARWSIRRGNAQGYPLPHPRIFEQLGWRALLLGVVAYFVLLPVSSLLPALTAVISAVATLLILGLWLRFYGAVSADDRRSTMGTLAILPLLPLATFVTGGFVGYGICWIISIVSFVFVVATRRLWFYLAAPIVIYLGLSLFVTYIGQRGELRSVVWNEQTTLFERLNRTSRIVAEFELLDLNKPKHVWALHVRLNQNILVGAGIERHQTGYVDLSYGSTVPWWVLIPRAVWPDKPAVGGGGDLVTSFTGIKFSEGTSVGVGQVLEFYMNFGLAGVLIGFAGLGFLLMRLDSRIMLAIGRCDMRTFLLYSMPGLTLLQPGGNLLEIIVAAAAAFAAAQAIVSFRILRPAHSGSRPAALF